MNTVCGAKLRLTCYDNRCVEIRLLNRSNIDNNTNTILISNNMMVKGAKREVQNPIWKSHSMMHTRFETTRDPQVTPSLSRAVKTPTALNPWMLQRILNIQPYETNYSAWVSLLVSFIFLSTFLTFPLYQRDVKILPLHVSEFAHFTVSAPSFFVYDHLLDPSTVNCTSKYLQEDAFLLEKLRTHPRWVVQRWKTLFQKAFEKERFVCDTIITTNQISDKTSAPSRRSWAESTLLAP